MVIDPRNRFFPFFHLIALGTLVLTVSYIIFRTQNNSSGIRSKVSDNAIKKEISNLLSDSLKDSPVFGCKLITRPFFNAFNPNNDLFFVTVNGLSKKGDTLVSILCRSQRFGLRADDYHLNSINSLLPLAFNSADDSESKLGSIAGIELLLTDAYLKFGAHLNRGRFNPDTLMLEWNPNKLSVTWLETLSAGITTGSISKALNTLEPDCNEYLKLKKYLSYLLDEPLKKHNSNTEFNSISSPEKRSFFSAISTFTRKNAHDSCNVNDLSCTLNDSVRAKIIEYLEMDMERYRWHSTIRPKQYAIVNIPAADFVVYGSNTKRKHDTVTMYSRVVVGKPETPTPTLISSINNLFIYPYWNVPFDIAVKEILPVVKRDTTYLNRRNYEVLDAKGQVVENPGSLKWKLFNEDHLPIRFRQKWGPENSLGICKFNFENKYSVYLHDTNSKKYFRSDDRHQSHGCVRIERFKELATFLIKLNDIEISEDSLHKIFNTPEQRRIELKKPLKLWIEYHCIKFNGDGKLTFYDDKYNLNYKMTKLLEGQSHKKT